MTRALAILALAAAAAGCAPKLYARSVPPPGAVGRLHTGHRWSEVTEGTVLAFTCVRLGAPCRGASARSADPAIAEVLPASLAQLYVDYAGTAGVAQESTFVLVGKRPGVTRVHVDTAKGDVDLKVTVLPAVPVTAVAE